MGTTLSYPMLQPFREANQTMVNLARWRPLSGLIAVMVDGRAETVSELAGHGKLLFDARHKHAGRPHHRAER